eukprot:2789451-Amphidinium_carterae.1
MFSEFSGELGAFLGMSLCNLQKLLQDYKGLISSRSMASIGERNVVSEQRPQFSAIAHCIIVGPPLASTSTKYA